MSSVLIVEQREQAGSDSYNRFEYQVHWIVYKSIRIGEKWFASAGSKSTLCFTL